MSCRTWELRHLRQLLRLCVRLQTACLLPLRSCAPCPQRRQPHQLLLLLLLLQRRPLGPCASLASGCGCLLVDLETLETGRLQPVFEKQGITAHSTQITVVSREHHKQDRGTAAAAGSGQGCHSVLSACMR
jgi:hypothetical protein